MAKVIFLHLSVILFTGGSASVHAGIPPPWEQTPLTHSPREQTLWEQTSSRRHPPRTGHPPQEQTSQEQTPHWSRHTSPGADTPPELTPPLESRLRHTVYERPVHILLECILVCIYSLLLVLVILHKKKLLYLVL